MTNETELKLDRIRRLAEEIGKESAYNGVTLDSLVFLSGKEEDEELTKEQLKYFFHGYYFGAKAGRNATPDNVSEYLVDTA